MNSNREPAREMSARRRYLARRYVKRPFPNYMIPLWRTVRTYGLPRWI